MMKFALNEAQKAFDASEVPVGAVIVKNAEIIGTGFNQVVTKNSVIWHAEINAINNASKALNNYRLTDCDIYVTLEPCHMCAKAIVDARISNLYFGALEPKTGAVQSIDKFLDKTHLNHNVSYQGGYLEESCSAILKEFFQLRRN
ncbi:tRNA adenosine(34) deaminase TadA [Gammaproteobacteria bacterium]|nr:tRNA adenosine(34) deaminase TadA [Gammaproteobacteria bacterium]